MIGKIIETIKETGCCAEPARPEIEPRQAEEAAQLFGALADPTRLGILNILAGSASEVCVCDITAAFKLGQPTISHHLKILKDAGLVNGDKRGKWVYYSLVKSRAGEVMAFLERLVVAPALKS